MDLDQGGTRRQQARVYLGPSLGWTEVPNNVGLVSVGGTTVVDLSWTTVWVNFNGAVTLQLPSAKAVQPNLGTLVSLPVTIADIGGFAQAQPITILPFGSEQIMGLASIQIKTNYGAYTLFPNPGAVGGWFSGS